MVSPHTSVSGIGAVVLKELYELSGLASATANRVACRCRPEDWGGSRRDYRLQARAWDRPSRSTALDDKSDRCRPRGDGELLRRCSEGRAGRKAAISPGPRAR